MKVRNLIIPLLLIVIQIGGFGCGMAKKDHMSNKEELINQVKEYLNEKYGSFSCEAVGVETESWYRGYDRVNLKTDLNGEKVLFFANRYSQDGRMRFEDNYFGVLVKNEYDERVTSCASEYFSDCFADVSTVSICYPDELRTGAGFDDLLKVREKITEKTVVVVIVKDTFGSEEEFNELSREFCAKWKQIGLPCFIRVICLGKDTLGEINKTNFREKGVLIENKLYEYSE